MPTIVRCLSISILPRFEQIRKQREKKDIKDIYPIIICPDNNSPPPTIYGNNFAFHPFSSASWCTNSCKNSSKIFVCCCNFHQFRFPASFEQYISSTFFVLVIWSPIWPLRAIYVIYVTRARIIITTKCWMRHLIWQFNCQSCCFFHTYTQSAIYTEYL